MKGLVNGMKKYLCILLAFALVLTLAACGGDPSSDLPDPDVEDTGEVSDGATPTDLDAPTAEPTPTPCRRTSPRSRSAASPSSRTASSRTLHTRA